jgi:hypothetical protein
VNHHHHHHYQQQQQQRQQSFSVLSKIYTMSIESNLELKLSTSITPKSLCCVFPEGADEASNPFEVASYTVGDGESLVLGSERGSLHCRTYEEGKLQSGNPTNRTHEPVDLPEGSFPGSVVSVIPATDAPRRVFLVLVDDNKGTSGSSGMYIASLVTLQNGNFTMMGNHQKKNALPRVSCACYVPSKGFLLCTGRKFITIERDVFLDVRRSSKKAKWNFSSVILPPPGARGDGASLTTIQNGQVAVIAIGNTVYAVTPRNDNVKVVTFNTSSQIHPLICLDVKDESMDSDWSSLLCANGREACVADVQYSTEHGIHCAPATRGMITLASPILSAVSLWPWLAILTSDGLVSIRSPSCLAIPLKTVEVGTRPNDFFTLVKSNQPNRLISLSYSGQAKLLQCWPDTKQDLADRLMRHAIDAFGSNGFPRSELAEAVGASFTATSYVGPEPTPKSKSLLRLYLEAILGLSDLEGGAKTGWPTEYSTPSSSDQPTKAAYRTAFEEASATQYRQTPSRDPDSFSPVVTAATPHALLTATALLCLVCTQSTPQPKASLANRAAKQCATKMGIVLSSDGYKGATKVCESIAMQLVKQYSFSMSNRGTQSNRLSANHQMEFVEAATWLLRGCGHHSEALGVMWEKFSRSTGDENYGKWSQIKYESYTATHLSDLWSTSQESACHLVLQCPATRRLLENNPVLGLHVFISLNPQNSQQWSQLVAKEDPLSSSKYPAQCIQLLKSIHPSTSISTEEGELPMNSGRSLAIAFLESAIGISSGRIADADEFESLPELKHEEERLSDFHDELTYLLLEGVLSERTTRGESHDSTPLGKLYRQHLQKLLQWPGAKIRAEKLLQNLPSTFQQEQALVMGRLGKHVEALRILYKDCQSMELALQYCDLRYGQLQAKASRGPPSSSSKKQECVYLPLVQVALEDDDTAAAIQVLALRKSAIDRAAALRLLPSNIPVSAVARPFLIPALIDSESQARRLKVMSSLLRARHTALEQQLTDAQLKAQASLSTILSKVASSQKIGELLHQTKPKPLAPSTSTSATFPEVTIIKHFFPRHVIVQAKVTNNSSVIEGRFLANVAFVVAESSEEAIQPLSSIKIKALPFGRQGSSWFILLAAPNRMEGAAILTCELRYTVLGSTETPQQREGGRTFVEELQDLDVMPRDFT